MQCAVIGRIQWGCDEGHVETNRMHYHHHHSHSQEHIELLSQAKAHGSIFSATGVVHLTANNIFQSIALKQFKILCEKLGKDKTLHEHQEKSKYTAFDILERKGENLTMLTGTDLTAVLTWHQHPKVAGMKKDAKFVAWMEIKCCGKAPPAFKKWTHNDKKKLMRHSPTSLRRLTLQSVILKH